MMSCSTRPASSSAASVVSTRNTGDTSPNWKPNYTRQDAIVLNLLRACEAAIDAAMHVVRVHRLGLPQRSRDAFALMHEHHLLADRLNQHLQAMVGFHNIAIHRYREIELPILRAILERRLKDLREFARLLIELAGNQRPGS